MAFGVGTGDWGDDMPFGIDEEQPYLIEEKIIEIKKYNINYGDHRECKCGHIYYRHFDPYDEMDACGCKYCSCDEFQEKE